MTVEELNIIVTASIADAKSKLGSMKTALDTIKNAAKGATGNIDKITGSSTKLGGSLGKVVKVIALVVGAIKLLTKVINECVGAYQTQIEAEMKLETVMKNRLGATQGQINVIKNYAAELQNVGVIGDEVAMAGASQLSLYVSTTSAIKKLLPAMEDLAAFQYGTDVTAENMQGIADTVGKILNSGSLSTLAEKGFRITNKDLATWNALETEEERIAFLADLIEKSVGGYNEKLANTPIGALTQLKNAWGDLKETVGSAFGGMLTRVYQWITAIISAVNTALTAVKAFFAAIFGGGKGGVTESAKAAQTATAGISGNLKSASGSAKATAKALRGLAGIDELTTLTKTNAGGGALGSTGIGGAGVAGDIDEEAETLLGSLTNKIAGWWEGVKERCNLQGVFDSFSHLWDSIVDFYEVRIKPYVDNFIEYISGLWETLKEYFTSTFEGALTSLGGVVEFITGLINTVVSLLTINFDGIKQGALDMWEGFKSILEGIWQNIQSVINLFSNFCGNVWDGIKGNFEAFGEVISTLWQRVKEFFEPIGEWISGIFQPIKDFFNNIIEWFKNIIEPISNFFQDGGIGAAWDSIKSKSVTLKAKVEDVKGSVRSAVVTAWNTIKDKAASLTATVKDGASAVTTKIKDIWDKVVNKTATLTAGITQTFDSTVIPALKSAWDAVKTKTATLTTKITEGSAAVRAAVKGAWDAVKDKVATLTATVKEGASAVSTKVKGIWDGIISKSATLTAKISKLFDLSLSDGIQAVWRSLTTKTVTLTAKITETSATVRAAVKSAWETIKEKTATLTATVKDGASAVREKITALWGNITSKAVTLTANITKNFTASVSEALEAVWRNLVNKTATLTSKLSGNSVVESFKQKWDAIKDKSVTMVAKFDNLMTTAWNKFADALNAAIVVLNKIPGINITYRLPKLATGGITNGATMAMIGEAGKEAVLPLENNTGWMSTLANQLVKAMGNSNSGFNGALNITLNVGGKEFGKACINSINQAQSAAGAILLNI